MKYFAKALVVPTEIVQTAVWYFPTIVSLKADKIVRQYLVFLLYLLNNYILHGIRNILM